MNEDLSIPALPGPAKELSGSGFFLETTSPAKMSIWSKNSGSMVLTTVFTSEELARVYRCLHCVHLAYMYLFVPHDDKSTHG